MFPKLSKWEKYLKNMEEKSIKNALEVTKELHNLYTQLHVISVKSCFRSVFVIFLKQTKWLFSACTVLIKNVFKEMNKMITPFLLQKKKNQMWQNHMIYIGLFYPVHWNSHVSRHTIWAPDYSSQLAKKAGIGIFPWIYFQYDFKHHVLKIPQSSFPLLWLGVTSAKSSLTSPFVV